MLKVERWVLAGEGHLSMRPPEEAWPHLSAQSLLPRTVGTARLTPPWSSGGRQSSGSGKLHGPIDAIFLPWHSYLFPIPQKGTQVLIGDIRVMIEKKGIEIWLLREWPQTA